LVPQDLGLKCHSEVQIIKYRAHKKGLEIIMSSLHIKLSRRIGFLGQGPRSVAPGVMFKHWEDLKIIMS